MSSMPPQGPDQGPDHAGSNFQGSNHEGPNEQGPDYLDHSSAPLPPAHDGDQDKRKRLLVLGGVVGAGVVIAGGAWAATSFFATGAQPAEALPASTIAYVSVDIDPSGGQKIEAIRTLKKFPAFEEELDIETDDDLRERFFEEMLESGECDGLDYAEDVKPWLGSRMAVAAIDAGEEQPSPVVVVQVTDSGAAEEGMQKLVDTCGGQGSDSEEGSDTGAWNIEGDWLVAGETQDIVDKVVDDAAKSSLADDEAFGRWTGEAGEDGIMTMYVAKAAADHFAELTGNGMLGSPFMSPDMAMGGIEGMDESEAPAEELPEELKEVLERFEGMAATVRFDDGALELEYAVSNYQPEIAGLFDSEAGVDLLSSLPSDTVGAYAVGFEEGWVQALVDYFEEVVPEGEMSAEDMLAEAEAATGLTLPEDVETLFGDGVAIAVGPGIDPDAIANGGPEEVPVGMRIAGDADDIQAVLDKLKEQAGPELAPYLEVTEGDGFAVLGLQEEFRAELEEKGSLGDSEAYEGVVDADAQSVLFVDFDADDNWLVRLSKDDPEASENLEPLSALGVSASADDEVIHGLLKLTTD